MSYGRGWAGAGIALVVGVGCTGWQSGGERTALVEIVNVSERDFRDNATVQVWPEFPAASLGWGASGVAVAEVIAAEEGHVESVRILEAPDALIGTAVYQAVLQWRIRAPLEGDEVPRRVRTKLFFYFGIIEGQACVRTPEQVREGRC